MADPKEPHHKAAQGKETDSRPHPQEADQSTAQSPLPAPPQQPADPLAFEVGNFGDPKQGFVVFGPDGGVEKTFATSVEAKKYAESRRAAYQASRASLQPQLEQIAAKARRPAPMPASSPAKPSPRPQPIDLADIPARPGNAPSPVMSGRAGNFYGVAAALQSAASALSGLANKAVDLPLPSPGFTRPNASASWLSAQPTRATPASVQGSPAPMTGSTRPATQPPRPATSPTAQAGVGIAAAPASAPEPYGLSSPSFASKLIAGIAKSIGSAVQANLGPLKTAIGSSVGGVTQSISPSQMIKGFAASFKAALGNPAGGIPVGVGGWAGSAAASIASHASHAWGGAAAAARSGASGVAASWDALRGGAGAAGIARAFAGGVGGTAGSIMGGAASGIGIVGKVVVGFVELAEKMRAFADRVVDANAHLSRWNGAIGVAYMQLSWGDFRRQVNYGRATQGTAVSAARAVDQMRDAWQGVDQLRGNVENRAATVGATFSGAVGADLSRFANIINDKLQEADPNGWVSGGTVAGLYAGVKGFGAAYVDAWVNHPIESTLTLGISAYIRGIFGGQEEARKAADAAVTNMAAGAMDPNPWGAELNRWARSGPMLPRRPAPRP